MEASDQIKQQVTQAFADKTPLNINGGGSKRFLGVQSDADTLSTSNHSGLISYEPSELVFTAKAGTTLNELRTTLADQKQMLAFEPPAFDDAATIGGTCLLYTSPSPRD